MADPVFKPVAQDDLDVALVLMREFYAHEGLAFDEAAAGRALLGLIGDDRFGRAFLIGLETDVAGYAVLTFGYSLEFQGRDAFVDELYLREPYRGRGLGKRALEFLSEVCAQQGIRALHLEVERANYRAQAVYREFKFQDHDRYLMTKWIESEEPNLSPPNA
jgi:GNAT superfamily N-acetyltransferase